MKEYYMQKNLRVNNLADDINTIVGGGPWAFVCLFGREWQAGHPDGGVYIHGLFKQIPAEIT